MNKYNKIILNEHINKVDIPTTTPIILGSTSRNRRKIVEYLEWDIKYDSHTIDEKKIRTNNPYDLPLMIAKAKAESLYNKIQCESILITCDQIVLCNNNILEKPESIDEAYKFFKSYSNNHIKLINGIVLTHYPTNRQITNIDISTIYFNNITEENINDLIKNTNIFTSAGGIIIEDENMSKLIKNIEGSISSIMGLNYELLINMIKNIIPASE